MLSGREHVVGWSGHGNNKSEMDSLFSAMFPLNDDDLELLIFSHECTVHGQRGAFCRSVGTD